MIKVAITGNIASGKSAVEKILLEKGYKVFDTDKIAHEILKNNEDVKNIFGTTDRKELGKIVFDNQEKLKQLEEIIHPKVKEEILKIFEIEEEIVFISVPQLFESGFDKLFDKIIFISADERIRLERLMKRNSLNLEDAQKRISAQLNENEKIKKSDFLIENNSNIENLTEKIDEALKNI